MNENQMYNSSYAFKSYYENASEKDLLVDLLNDKFIFKKNPIKILDLGCHDGFLIKKILTQYATRLPETVYLTGVDPSACALEKYKNTDFGSNIIVNTFHGTAESFFEQNTTRLLHSAFIGPPIFKMLYLKFIKLLNQD